MFYKFKLLHVSQDSVKLTFVLYKIVKKILLLHFLSVLFWYKNKNVCKIKKRNLLSL